MNLAVKGTPATWRHSTARQVETAILQLVVARQSTVARAAKRLVDVVSSTLGLMLTAPLIVLVTPLIVLESSGPVFFRQCRIGRDGRPFTMLKLRSMDAHGRVTRIGRLLRPLGIDELPQLWHVLTGEMSLVGPRPEIPDLVRRWQRDLHSYAARHVVRPGITGWAQVNGLRGDVSIAERLRFDLQYIREWSLAMDGRILLKSIPTVWRDTRRALRN